MPHRATPEAPDTIQALTLAVASYPDVDPGRASRAVWDDIFSYDRWCVGDGAWAADPGHDSTVVSMLHERAVHAAPSIGRQVLLAS